MRFNDNFFKNFLLDAPLPLALERAMECKLLSTKEFRSPILDIGCGEGIFAKKLLKEKIEVGIDPNQSELNRARFYDAYDELIHCWGDKIAKKDGVFNTILSNSVLEHIPEIDKVLVEAHRLLSDEGIMYLTLPTNRFDQYTIVAQILAKLRLKGLQKYYQRGFNKFWAHYHYYNTDDWIKKFERNGFSVVEFQEYASKGVCLFNAASIPFSFFPFVTKKLFNRWFLFPRLRKFTAYILHALFKPLTDNPTAEAGRGGLVFFCLAKRK